MADLFGGQEWDEDDDEDPPYSFATYCGFALLAYAGIWAAEPAIAWFWGFMHYVVPGA